MASKVVGRDVPPEAGMRVESVDGWKGLGTIIQMSSDMTTASVRWDNGNMERDAAIGAGGAYSLVSTGPASARPTSNTYTSSGSAYTAPPASGTVDGRKATRGLAPPVQSYAPNPSLASRGSPPPPAANQQRSAPSPASSGGNGPMDWLMPSTTDYKTTDYTNGNGNGANIASQYPSTQGSVKTTGQSAKIGLGSTTVGLSLFGNKVDYMLPGGPAQLSQKLDKHDEIVEVDGVRVQEQEITQMLVGEDANSTLRLKVRKAHTGQMISVELPRVPKRSMEGMVRLFELLTQLKQNGHNNEGVERETFPANQQLTSPLVDAVVALVSQIQIEQHNREGSSKNEFQSLYTEVRNHLAEAYTEIDAMEQVKGRFTAEAAVLRDEAERARDEASRYRQQVDKILAQVDSKSIALEDVKSQLATVRDKLNHEVEEERALHGQLDDWKQTHHLSDQEVKAIVRELAQKKEDLAQEIEGGMQKDFDIRRLQAQCALYVEELEAARLSILAKDEEMMRRSMEDVELEKKIEALKDHLEQAFETVQAKDAEVMATKMSVAERVAEMAASKDRQIDEMARSMVAKADEFSAASAAIAQIKLQVAELVQELAERGNKLAQTSANLATSEKSEEDLRAALDLATQKIEELERDREIASWRAGDVLEVTVVGAKNIPTGKKGDEVYVMLNLDHKYQVQKTEQVVGAHPTFGKEFVCNIAQTNRNFNAAVYAGQPGKSGEFIGGCKVSLFEVPSFPGMESGFELTDEDGNPVVDAQGSVSRVELVLARCNFDKRREALISERTKNLDAATLEVAKDEAKIGALQEEVASLMQQLEALHPVVEREKQLSEEVARFRVLLAECGGKIESQEMLIAELEESVKSKAAKLAAAQKDLVQKEKERQAMQAELEGEGSRLKIQVEADAETIREGLAILAERDALATKVKQLEDEISQVRKDLGSSEGKREASAKGESSRVRELEAEGKAQSEEVAALKVALSKLQGGLDSEKDAHDEDAKELSLEKKHDSQLEADLAAADKKTRVLEQEVFNANKRIHELEEELGEMRKRASGLDAQLTTLQNSADGDIVNQQAEQIRELEWKVKELAGASSGDVGASERVAELEKQVEELSSELARLEATLSAKDSEIAKLKVELEVDEKRIEEDERRWAERSTKVGSDTADQERRLHEFEAKLADAERQMDAKAERDGKEAGKLRKELLDKTAADSKREKQLEAKIEELEKQGKAEKENKAKDAPPAAQAGGGGGAREQELERKIQDLEAKLRDAAAAEPAGGNGKKEYEAEVMRLQKQVGGLQDQWLETQQKDKADNQVEVKKLNDRIESLLHQLDEAERKMRECTCGVLSSGGAAKRLSAPPPAAPGAQAARSVPPTARSPTPTSASPAAMDSGSPRAPRGVIGMKIENQAPHKVMSVTELMDEKGAIVNEKVNLGDVLVEINGVPVSSMPVGEVIQRVSGSAGTLVRLSFRNVEDGREYSVTAQRHVPLAQQKAYAASLRMHTVQA